MAEPDPGTHYRWWLVDERTGKRRLSSWRMTPAVAAELHPGAEIELSSAEVRAPIGSASDSGRKPA